MCTPRGGRNVVGQVLNVHVHFEMDVFFMRSPCAQYEQLYNLIVVPTCAAVCYMRYKLFQNQKVHRTHKKELSLPSAVCTMRAPTVLTTTWWWWWHFAIASQSIALYSTLHAQSVYVMEWKSILYIPTYASAILIHDGRARIVRAISQERNMLCDDNIQVNECVVDDDDDVNDESSSSSIEGAFKHLRQNTLTQTRCARARGVHNIEALAGEWDGVYVVCYASETCRII